MKTSNIIDSMYQAEAVQKTASAKTYAGLVSGKYQKLTEKEYQKMVKNVADNKSVDIGELQNMKKLKDEIETKTLGARRKLGVAATAGGLLAINPGYQAYQDHKDQQEKQAGWIEKGHDGNLHFSDAYDDMLPAAIYDEEWKALGDDDWTPEEERQVNSRAQKRVDEAFAYGDSLIAKHPQRDKMLEDLTYNQKRQSVTSPLSNPVTLGIAAGVPIAAAVGMRKWNNKRHMIRPNANMGKTIAGGLLGGLALGTKAGLALDERKRKQMGYQPRNTGYMPSIEDEVSDAVYQKYWPRNSENFPYYGFKDASEEINELFIKQASIVSAVKSVGQSIKKRDADHKQFEELWSALSKEEKKSILVGVNFKVKKPPEKKASEEIDMLMRKEAYDSEGEELKFIRKADKDAVRHLTNKGLYPGDDEKLYPQRPYEPQLQKMDAKYLSAVPAAAAIGTLPGVLKKNKKMLGVGAAVGAGVGLSGLGAVAGKKLFNYHRDMKDYKDEFRNYEYALLDAPEEHLKNQKYFDEYVKYVQSKYPTAQADTMLKGRFGYYYDKSASEEIDALYATQMEKTAGVGWDVHGYKKEDLDKFYADQQAIAGADEDAEKYLKSQGVEQPNWSAMYARKPEKPHGLGPYVNIGTPAVAAMLGAYPGAAMDKPKVMGIGAAIGAGLGVAGVGALHARNFLNYRKDSKLYDERIKNAPKAQEQSSQYWDKYKEYLGTKYTPKQVQMIMDYEYRPSEHAIRAESPTTNYKANRYLMDEYGDPSHYDLLTDEVYGEKPEIRNLSQEQIDQFRAQYAAAMEKAKASGELDKDQYLREGTDAFLKRLDALKAAGADTYRLEYE